MCPVFDATCWCVFFSGRGRRNNVVRPSFFWKLKDKPLLCCVNGHTFLKFPPIFAFFPCKWCLFLVLPLLSALLWWTSGKKSSINTKAAPNALSLGETLGKEEFKTTTMTTSPNPQPVGWLTYIENSPVKTGALIWIQQNIFQQKRNFLPCPAVSYTQEGICHQFPGLKNNNLRDNRRGGFYPPKPWYCSNCTASLIPPLP